MWDKERDDFEQDGLDEAEYLQQCDELYSKFKAVEKTFLKDEDNDPFAVFEVAERLFFESLEATCKVDKEILEEETDEPIALCKHKFAELLVEMIPYFNVSMPDLLGALEAIKQEVFHNYKEVQGDRTAKIDDSNMKRFGFKNFKNLN